MYISEKAYHQLKFDYNSNGGPKRQYPKTPWPCKLSKSHAEKRAAAIEKWRSTIELFNEEEEEKLRVEGLHIVLLDGKTERVEFDTAGAGVVSVRKVRWWWRFLKSLVCCGR